MLIRNANHTRAVFTFCFVLERCKTKRVRLERFCWCLVLQKALLATEGSTINKIPKHSTVYTSTLPCLPDPPFDFLRVWFRDYVLPAHIFIGNDNEQCQKYLHAVTPCGHLNTIVGLRTRIQVHSKAFQRQYLFGASVLHVG